MRIVAIALIVAGCLLIADPVSAGSPDKVAGNQEFVSVQNSALNNPSTTAIETLSSGPASGEDSFHEHEFVYIPPPVSDVTDPRFYSGSFEFVPSGTGQAGGTLVQPVWGAVPLSQIQNHTVSADSDEIPASETTAAAKPTPTATATPKPTATPAQPKPTTTPPPPSPTAAATATPISSKTPTTSTDANSENTLVQYSVSGTIPDDIEDPRFYRGSYVYNPQTRVLKPGMIDAPPTIPEKPSAGTAVDCPDGTCQAPPPSQSSGLFPRRGRAMYYNPGIMAQVLAFRLETSHVSSCSNCVGYVALLGREDLNRKVWIEWPDGDVEGPFLVIDCAAKHHVAALLARNWVVDVDYATAIRHNMSSPLPVTVWDHRPGIASSIYGN